MVFGTTVEMKLHIQYLRESTVGLKEEKKKQTFAEPCWIISRVLDATGLRVVELFFSLSVLNEK